MELQPQRQPSSDGHAANPKRLVAAGDWSKAEDFRRKGQALIWQHRHRARHPGLEGGVSRCHPHLMLEAPGTGGRAFPVIFWRKGH